MLIQIICLALVLAHAEYNEQFDTSGALRPAFAKFARQFSLRPLHPDADSAQFFLDQPLNDRLKILPKPLVLSNEEYALVQRGARQRARALTAMFLDMVQGSWEGSERACRYRDLLRTVNAYPPLELREIYRGKTAADINFSHGSDIIRDPLGRFVVMEDNVGRIGGVGDVRGMTLQFNKTLGVRREYLSPTTRAVLAFLKDLPLEKHSQVLVLEPETSLAHGTNPNQDLEDDRIRRELALFNFAQWPERNLIAKRAEIEAGHITHIINLSDVMEMRTDSVNKKLLLDDFRLGKIKLFRSPGTDVLTNKSLLMHTDQAIRDYLGEEPILPTIPTFGVTALLQKDEVLKRVVAVGGKGVQFTSRMSSIERSAFLTSNSIEAADQDYNIKSLTPIHVRQPFVSSSFLPNTSPTDWVRFNVDIRALVSVVNGEALPFPPLWGRAQLRLPGSLSNVAQHGFLLNVTTPNLCEGLLEE